MVDDLNSQKDLKESFVDPILGSMVYSPVLYSGCCIYCIERERERERGDTLIHMYLYVIVNMIYMYKNVHYATISIVLTQLEPWCPCIPSSAL